MKKIWSSNPCVGCLKPNDMIVICEIEFDLIDELETDFMDEVEPKNIHMQILSFYIYMVISHMSFLICN